MKSTEIHHYNRQEVCKFLTRTNCFRKLCGGKFSSRKQDLYNTNEHSRFQMVVYTFNKVDSFENAE